MPGRICLYRTQDLEGNDDPYCLECWEAFHHDGDLGYRMSWYYADRQECIEENTKEVLECQKTTENTAPISP